MSETNKLQTKLCKGSKYKVTSKGDSTQNIVTIGEFIGYLQFGQDSALQIKMSCIDPDLDGVTRIIPTAAVLFIDVIELKEEEEIKKKDTPMVSYG